MTRIVFAALVCFLMTSSPASSQDDSSRKIIAALEKSNTLLEEQLATLKTQLNAEKMTREELEAEIDELKKDAEQLQSENDRFRKRLKEDKAAEIPRTLSEILQNDAVVVGDYRFPKFDTTGKWSLTIVDRDGTKFTGKYFVHKSGEATGGTVDVKGTVVGNKLTFEVVGTATLAAKVSGTLRNNELRLDYIGFRGNQAVLLAPNVK